MKNNGLITAFSLTLLASLGGALVAQALPASPTSIAQQADAPQIDGFSVVSVDALTPGTELVFTLQGTPGARATLTLGNIATNLPMREVDLGVYEGRYTIRSSDRLSDTTIIRANLQQGDRVSSVRLQQPLVASSPSATGTTPGTGSTPPTTSGTAQPFYIDRFTAEPVPQLEPGTELVFTLVGTANATATYSIEGIAVDRPMQEIAPGTYRGDYVIRRQDVFPSAGATVTATLQANGQILRTRLDRALVATGNSNSATTPLTLEVISPQNNSRVSGTITVAGRSAPNTTVDVNVRAVNSLGGIVGVNRDVFSQRIQADAEGDFEFSFQPGIAVPGTRYEVSLQASNGSQTAEESLVLLQR